MRWRPSSNSVRARLRERSVESPMSEPEQRGFCCVCMETTTLRRGSGSEVYPHRADLAEVVVWICDRCGGHVGGHRGGRGAPLGSVPTPELRLARMRLHELIDPLWRAGRIRRGELYRRLSDDVGWDVHVARVSTLEEGRNLWRAAAAIRRELDDSDSAFESPALGRPTGDPSPIAPLPTVEQGLARCSGREEHL